MPCAKKIPTGKAGCRSTLPLGPPRVMGALLGQQLGRTVDVSNSFELREGAGGRGTIDEAFLTKKIEQGEWGCLGAV